MPAEHSSNSRVDNINANKIISQSGSKWNVEEVGEVRKSRELPCYVCQSIGNIIDDDDSKRANGSEIDFSNVNKSHRFMREFLAYINHASVERTNKRCRRTNETQAKTVPTYLFSFLQSFLLPSPVYLDISRQLFARTITWSFRAIISFFLQLS